MAQDDLFGNLEHGSYDGVVFAVVDIQIHTASAVVRHKFPHRPGQRLEYTGREPVSGSIRAAMFANLQLFPLATNVLWPDAVQTLREKVQLQKPLPLVIPTFGRIEKAYVTLDEQYTATQRNGCYITMHFEEDSEDVIAKGKSIGSISKTSSSAITADNELAAALLVIQQKMQDAEGNALPDFKSAIKAFQTSLNDANDNLANPIAQAASIVAAVDDLLKTAKGLSDPRNWAARDALLELRDNTISSVNELHATTRNIKTYVTAINTTVGAVAAVVGASVADILALNTFPDPNDIPRDSEVLYYEP